MLLDLKHNPAIRGMQISKNLVCYFSHRQSNNLSQCQHLKVCKNLWVVILSSYFPVRAPMEGGTDEKTCIMRSQPPLLYLSDNIT